MPIRNSKFIIRNSSRPGAWSAVRQQLATWEKPALLTLVKDLYEAAAENRDFIHARSKAGECGDEALGKEGRC